MALESASRILIIDDEPQLRNMLHRLFSGEGYPVTTAETGAQAMQRLKASIFALRCEAALCELGGTEEVRYPQ